MLVKHLTALTKQTQPMRPTLQRSSFLRFRLRTCGTRLNEFSLQWKPKSQTLQTASKKTNWTVLKQTLSNQMATWGGKKLRRISWTRNCYKTIQTTALTLKKPLCTLLSMIQTKSDNTVSLLTNFICSRKSERRLLFKLWLYDIKCRWNLNFSS